VHSRVYMEAFMYIKLTKGKNAKKTSVYLVEAYRDQKKVKQRIVKKYGILEELVKEDPFILDKLKQEALRLSEEKPDDLIPLTIDLSKTNEKSSNIKNIGSVYLQKEFDKLNLSPLIKKLTKNSKIKYDLYQALSLLTISRILNPNSKLQTHTHKDQLYLAYDVSLDDLYRSLDHFTLHKDACIKHIDQHMVKHYHRQKDLVFYDVTNFYFESNATSEIKEVGPSKENSKHPIVTMGLYIDEQNFPITYDMFKGNTHDSKTFIPSFNKMKDELGINKCIVVADKGINGGNNIKHLIDHQHGYIFSSKVRGASKSIIDLTLDEKDYVVIDKAFKYKEALISRKIIYENEMGRQKSIQVEEKVVIFYSKNYADKAKHERDKVLESLEKYIQNPKLLKGKTKIGRLKYLSQQEFNQETGECVQTQLKVTKNEAKIKKDESLDGFYMISTNQVHLKGAEIIGKYRGLWQIEKSFRILKSQLDGRPVYVSTDSHIKGHFFTCFMALLLTRIIEHKLKKEISVEEIQKSFQKMNVLEIEKDIYKVLKYEYSQRKIQDLYGEVIDKAYIKKETMNQIFKSIR
jgi:transposase